MAANKFASMLHKNCHKIIVILVYAVLEWILILLLLLNSSFSYLIANFAKFFGLKHSCTWCSRLDHVFNSENKNSHFDHVCEAHGTEISKMSYCTSHNKLADSKNLCIHCSSSRSTNDISSTVAFFTWMSESVSEGVEEDRCSCCDQILTRKVFPQPLLFKPSWDVLLEYFHKNKIEFEADLVKKKTEFQENGSINDDDEMTLEKGDEQQLLDGRKKAETVEECVSDSNVEVQEWNSSQTTDDPFWNLGCNEDDESVYIADMLLQNAELMDSDRFICIELIDTEAAAAREMSLTSSSEDVEERRHNGQGLPVEEANCAADTKFEVLEASDVDTVEMSSKLTKEDAHKFSEYQQKDYKLEEQDNGGAVGGTILPGCSETESFVNDSTKISHESSYRDSVHQLETVESGMEVEGGVESLKTRIEAQEKAVKALYAELEEERKAAAEAAKETMAMITKLQEEKAAMQMEALQYQRMMEEQAEYDQEALQLLNDLMLKREKEKKELEKELEMYRGNEKTVMVRRRKGSLIRTTSNASSNNGEDDEYDDSHLDDSLEETGVECITNSIIPDISLAEFDEERVSILEELKVLEAKLLALHDDDEAQAQAQQSGDTDDVMAKKLLPLFDAAENEFADEDDDDDEEEMCKFYEGNKKMLIHEELGHVYERLQALEADKDFLKHCIRSMMKGNQGMPLLQEILQHLRDLKSVELYARTMPGIPLPDASNVI